MKFYVTIEETVCDKFLIETDDMEEAMRIAEEKYHSGELVLEPGVVTSRKMAAETEDGREYTQWVEF
jgi:hypothetical protein